MAVEDIISRAMINYDLVAIGAAAGFILAKQMNRRKRNQMGMGGF